MRYQLLDAWDMDFGVLQPLLGAGAQLQPRVRGGAVVGDQRLADRRVARPRAAPAQRPGGAPTRRPSYAVAEIAAWATTPASSRSCSAFGPASRSGGASTGRCTRPPIAHDLPIGIHFGGQGGTPITGAGWPSMYLEDHAGMSTAFQAQVISLICEGVFEHFPKLKIVLIEGGFAWVPPLAWRLDSAWRKLRDEVPRPASASRPSTSPSTSGSPRSRWRSRRVAEQFVEMLEHAPWLQDRLMFSTDYPHWDFDAPERGAAQDQAARRLRGRS